MVKRAVIREGVIIYKMVEGKPIGQCRVNMCGVAEVVEEREKEIVITANNNQTYLVDKIYVGNIAGD